MRLILTLINGEEHQYEVEGKSCIIGRSQKSDVVVPHEGISRHHCQIELDKGEFYVTDLGSTNGVLIDGIKIEPNKRTKYLTYLPLAFGPVQGLRIENTDERTKSAFTPNPIPGNPASTGQTKTIKLEIEEKPSGKVKAKVRSSIRVEEKKKPNLVAVGLVLVVIIGLGLWYFSQEESNSDTAAEVAAP